MNIDDVFNYIGQFGASQKKYFFVSTFTVAVFTATATFNQQFVCWQPDFHCVSLNGSRLANSCFNGSVRSCHAIIYSTDYSTLITEWDLVCEESWRPRVAQSAFMLGLVVSSLLSGVLSDRYGRLRTLCVLSALSVPCIIAQAFATSVNMYIIARLLNGVVHMGIVLATVVLGQELVGAEYRALVGNIGGCAFAVGLVVLAPLAAVCRQWRHLVAVTAVMGVLPPLLWFYIPESPRWLLVSGRREQALNVLRQLAAGNGRKLAPSQLSELRSPPISHATTGRATSDSLAQLVRSTRGCVWLAVLVLVWFFANLSYYSLTAASASVGGDRFVNFAISGLVDLPAHLLVYVTVDRFGRRRSVCACLALTVVFCAGVIVIPAAGDGKISWRSVSLWCAKLCSSSVFTMEYIHTLEIFPTSVRNSGVSLVNGLARLSGLIYPFMSALDEVMLGSQYVVLSVMGACCALLVPLLPETGGGRPLCSTVHEMLTAHPSTGCTCCDGQTEPLSSPHYARLHDDMQPLTADCEVLDELTTCQLDRDVDGESDEDRLL